MVNISRFSGKCDLRDSLEIHEYTLEELQNNVAIYVGYNKEPLHIEKMSDLIPYYPYIISLGHYNNSERKSEIHLSSMSFVDYEERDILENYLNYLLKVYNRCKRKKVEFNIEDAVNEVCWRDWNKSQVTELANRVKEKGKKASIDGIHLKMHEYYRQELVNEMLANDINPADYGYERFIKK